MRQRKIQYVDKVVHFDGELKEAKTLDGKQRTASSDFTITPILPFDVGILEYPSMFFAAADIREISYGITPFNGFHRNKVIPIARAPGSKRAKQA